MNYNVSGGASWRQVVYPEQIRTWRYFQSIQPKTQGSAEGFTPSECIITTKNSSHQRNQQLEVDRCVRILYRFRWRGDLGFPRLTHTPMMPCLLTCVHLHCCRGSNELETRKTCSALCRHRHYWDSNTLDQHTGIRVTSICLLFPTLDFKTSTMISFRFTTTSFLLTLSRIWVLDDEGSKGSDISWVLLSSLSCC